MAFKKQTAKTVVAEKPTQTSKNLKVAAPAVAEITTKTVKAAAPAVAEKAVTVSETLTKTAATKVAAIAAKTSKVTFVLPKEAVENAETVAVLGDFNNWQNGIVLAKQKDGSFQTAVELEKGRSYEYRFLINGEKWENDWAAEAYAPTPFGNYNSVVTA